MPTAAYCGLLQQCISKSNSPHGCQLGAFFGPEAESWLLSWGWSGVRVAWLLFCNVCPQHPHNLDCMLPCLHVVHGICQRSGCCLPCVVMSSLALAVQISIASVALMQMVFLYSHVSSMKSSRLGRPFLREGRTGIPG